MEPRHSVVGCFLNSPAAVSGTYTKSEAVEIALTLVTAKGAHRVFVYEIIPDPHGSKVKPVFEIRKAEENYAKTR